MQGTCLKSHSKTPVSGKRLPLVPSMIQVPSRTLAPSRLTHLSRPSLAQVFLKSDRVARMVQSGGCSANDSREVFKKHIEKRVRSLPEIDGLSKETVLSSWMAKFDAIYRGEEDPRKQQARMTASAASELILSKEQLYEMFQNILGIKKFEHQLLYNACQVGASSVGLEPWVNRVQYNFCGPVLYRKTLKVMFCKCADDFMEVYIKSIYD